MAKDISNFFTRLFNRIFNPHPKDKRFENHQSFPTLEEAKNAFKKSKKKLFSINEWSDISAFSSEFKLYHKSGRIATEPEPVIGDFIRITLPGFKDHHWVEVTDKKSFPELAEFTVHPSRAPLEKEDPRRPVAHFLKQGSSSTFRVKRSGKTIFAWEMGKQEEINNEGGEAGDQKFRNSMIAVGGWIAFQKLQWGNLTKWLVDGED